MPDAFFSSGSRRYETVNKHNGIKKGLKGGEASRRNSGNFFHFHHLVK